MAELILLALLACALFLVGLCLPWLLAMLAAIAPIVLAIVLALWLFTALC